jgi:hypothetical protein
MFLRKQKKYQSLNRVSADEGYRKTFEKYVKSTLKNEWAILAKIVERTSS